MFRRGWLVLALVLLVTGCRSGERRIVLLVTVDTLRADHLGAYGNPLGLTPQLDRLAASSLVFDRAYTPAPVTLPAVASLMTSRYPEELGIGGNSTVLSPQAATMAGWFAAHGWRTAAIIGNFILREKSGMNAGFQRYHARFPQEERVRGLPERTARPMTRAALVLLDELLAESHRSVFLWVHYQDPHGPYTPPDGYRERYLPIALRAPDATRQLARSASVSGQGGIPVYQFLEDHRDPAFYRASYMGEVAYVDEMIGRLLKGIQQRGLTRNTVVVFTADHGESLGEDDYWFAHGEHLTDPQVHVPLMIQVPGRPSGRRADTASLLDLFPTLAAVAGGHAPAGAHGRNLLASGSETRAGALYLSNLSQGTTRRQGLIDRGFKYIVTRHPDRRAEQLFRLGEEERDLIDERTDLPISFAAELARARAALRLDGAVKTQTVSPEDEEALKALGYVDKR